MTISNFICTRCARPASTQTKFFFTNCSHLICLECLKKCIVNVKADSNGLYSVTCPVEQKIRKIMPLEKLPPDIRIVFNDLDKVSFTAQVKFATLLYLDLQIPYFWIAI